MKCWLSSAQLSSACRHHTTPLHCTALHHCSSALDSLQPASRPILPLLHSSFPLLERALLIDVTFLCCFTSTRVRLFFDRCSSRITICFLLFRPPSFLPSFLSLCSIASVIRTVRRPTKQNPDSRKWWPSSSTMHTTKPTRSTHKHNKTHCASINNA